MYITLEISQWYATRIVVTQEGNVNVQLDPVWSLSLAKTTT